jgi:hypothetical protein
MQHLALSVLWAFRSRKGPLSTDAYTHLAACDDCMALLGICQSSKSLEEAQRRAKEGGRPAAQSDSDQP